MIISVLSAPRENQTAKPGRPRDCRLLTVPIAADKGAEPLLPVNAALAPAFKLGCVMYACVVCGLCVCV